MPWRGKGYPLQYSGLENFMDCIAHGVAKSRTRLSDFHFTSLPMQGTQVRSLVQEDPTYHGATKPMNHQLLSQNTPELMLCNKRSYGNEKPANRN